jgi:hypothetical protein
VMITPKALRESSGFGLQNELPRLLRGGGRFRLLVEPDPRVAALVRRFESAARRFPNSTVRAVDPQRARLTIVDQREALVFLVPEADGTSTDQIAVWTDTKDFVGAELAYFRALWEHARPFPGSRAGSRSKG